MTDLEKLIEERDVVNGRLRELFAKGYANLSADEAEEARRSNLRSQDLGKKIDEQKSFESMQLEFNSRMQEGEKANRKYGVASGQEEREEKADGRKGLEGWQNASVKSLGEMFIESVAYKNYNPALKRSPEATFDMKTVFATSTDNSGTVGFAPETTRQPGLFVDFKLRQPIMDSIIPIGRTEQNAIVYMSEDTITNGDTGGAATYLGEQGTAMGEQAFSFTENTVNVRKVRTSVPVTDEMMQDAPMMVDYINNRLLELLALKKDTSLLSGSGTAPEIRGVLNTSGILTQAKSTDPTPDAFHKALTKIQVTGRVQPDAILLHPNDWQNIRLLRTNDGIYIFGAPQDPAITRMWGYPVTPTLGLTAGTALVGAFRASTGQFIRKDVSVLVSTEDGTNFQKGVMTVKAEMRLALVVFRPSGICTVTGL